MDCSRAMYAIGVVLCKANPSGEKLLDRINEDLNM